MLNPSLIHLIISVGLLVLLSFDAGNKDLLDTLKQLILLYSPSPLVIRGGKPSGSN